MPAQVDNTLGDSAITAHSVTAGLTGSGAARPITVERVIGNGLTFAAAWISRRRSRRTNCAVGHLNDAGNGNWQLVIQRDPPPVQADYAPGQTNATNATFGFGGATSRVVPARTAVIMHDRRPPTTSAASRRA